MRLNASGFRMPNRPCFAARQMKQAAQSYRIRVLHLAPNFFQLDRDVFDVLVTLIRIFRETTTHDALQVGGRVWIESRERWRRLADDLVEYFDLVLAGERLSVR